MDVLAWGTFVAAVLAVLVPVGLFFAGGWREKKHHEALLARFPTPLLVVEHEPVVPKAEQRGYGDTAEHRIKEMESRITMQNPGSQYPVEVVRVAFQLLWSRPGAQRQQWQEDVTSLMPFHEGRLILAPQKTKSGRIIVDPDPAARQKLQALPSSSHVDSQVVVTLADGRVEKGPVVSVLQGRKREQQWLWREELESTVA